MKGEIIKDESCRPITPSLNMCDMDERDWTSLESSSESIGECSGDEEMMVGLKRERNFPSQKRQLNERQIPGTTILIEREVSQAERMSLLSSQGVIADIRGSQLSGTSYFQPISTCTYHILTKSCQRIWSLSVKYREVKDTIKCLLGR